MFNIRMMRSSTFRDAIGSSGACDITEGGVGAGDDVGDRYHILLMIDGVFGAGRHTMEVYGLQWCWDDKRDLLNI